MRLAKTTCTRRIFLFLCSYRRLSSEQCDGQRLNTRRCGRGRRPQLQLLRQHHDPQRQMLELREYQRLQLEGSFVGDDWHKDA